MTTLFNNVDNIIKQRLFAKELGNHLINIGIKPAEVAKLFVSYYKGMYATSSKIGDGGMIVDKQGNVVKGASKNIGTPRYQSFSNVNFEGCSYFKENFGVRIYYVSCYYS